MSPEALKKPMIVKPYESGVSWRPRKPYTYPRLSALQLQEIQAEWERLERER